MVAVIYFAEVTPMAINHGGLGRARKRAYVRNRRVQERERAAARATAEARRARRSSMLRKIVAIWNARRAGGRAPSRCAAYVFDVARARGSHQRSSRARARVGRVRLPR
jgi:hypothetical protein